MHLLSDQRHGVVAAQIGIRAYLDASGAYFLG